MNRLIKAAEEFLRESSEDNTKLPMVSLAMCERAQKMLDRMKAAAAINDLEAFNKALILLYCAIPRGKNNKRPLETISSNFEERLTWEQEFLNLIKQAVEGKEVSSKKPVEKNDRIAMLMEENGLSGHPVTKEEEEYVKSMMGQDRNKYVGAWRVENAKTDRKFNDYIKSMEVPNVRTLWHGSLNSNFLSILSKGLQVNYSSGGMFGRGCYFADEFDKSRGYCSIGGARWRGGNDKYAFLGLFDVALGRQLVLDNSCSSLYSHHPLLRNKDSVFARKGTSLCRNEYVVYKDNVSTIRYIVMSA